MVEEYKPYIAIILFLLCISMSIITVYKIKSTMEKELNYLYINKYISEIELTSNMKLIWLVVNLNFYLFVGCLIYGKNREIIEKPFNKI